MTDEDAYNVGYEDGFEEGYWEGTGEAETDRDDLETIKQELRFLVTETKDLITDKDLLYRLGRLAGMTEEEIREVYMRW